MNLNTVYELLSNSQSWITHFYLSDWLTVSRLPAIMI